MTATQPQTPAPVAEAPAPAQPVQAVAAAPAPQGGEAPRAIQTSKGELSNSDPMASRILEEDKIRNSQTFRMDGGTRAISDVLGKKREAPLKGKFLRIPDRNSVG